MTKNIKIILILILILSGILIISFLSMVYSENKIEKFAKGRIYNSTEEIPYNKVGLLLGTGKYRTDGSLNYYYKFRIWIT